MGTRQSRNSQSEDQYEEVPNETSIDIETETVQCMKCSGIENLRELPCKHVLCSECLGKYLKKIKFLLTL